LQAMPATGKDFEVEMALQTTRVFMVRHGATVLSAEDRFAGATDVALSDEGRQQTQRLAERLSRENLVAVYASPLSRTMETAKILAARHKLPVQARDGLREINHGRWEQMTRREVEQKFPEEAAEWEKDPYTFAPEGGESGLQVTARALPALLKASRLTEKAARVGFDWRRTEDVFDKVDEEMDELREAVTKNDAQEMHDELGDLLFTIANIARKLGVNAGDALQSANRKFMRRFTTMEQKVREQGRNLDQLTLEQMDALWGEAKANERG